MTYGHCVLPVVCVIQRRIALAAHTPLSRKVGGTWRRRHTSDQAKAARVSLSTGGTPRSLAIAWLMACGVCSSKPGEWKVATSEEKRHRLHAEKTCSMEKK
ncbi:unnamed protein product [Microthlaspi erraticum]|uniref:Uncharacterized protein n=1 Tax=Microthlaspi erraticum TaxID=1685480 RepID=A0A6D2HQW0_9BRAS|nr:unnamed protein product [Microthlaspi erraticum]